MNAIGILAHNYYEHAQEFTQAPTRGMHVEVLGPLLPEREWLYRSGPTAALSMHRDLLDAPRERQKFRDSNRKPAF